MPPVRPTLAFVTCQKHADLTADDQVLVAALGRHGYAVIPELWDAPSAEWESYHAVVVRSPWDYFLRVPEFLAWLDSLEGRSIRLWNPLATLKWNVRKTYLQSLESAGIPIVPTVWVPQGSAPSLASLCRERGWDQVVVKPTYSGTAFGTWRAGPVFSTDDERLFAEAARERELMVQPFVPEIATVGELSVIFFGGEYSHTIRKRPAHGDFRVQTDFGGTVELIDPGAELIEQAARVLRAAPTPCLYARVDGCPVEGVLQLMELEVLEPSLFFLLAPEAAERFVVGFQRMT